jgi:hypothetical protein
MSKTSQKNRRRRITFSIESPDAKEVRTRFHLQAEKILQKGPFLLQMPSVPFQSERWSLSSIWN